MIGLVLSMIASRRAQALIVALLAGFATAAAVAAPVYLASATRGVVEAEVAAARPEERSIGVQHTMETANPNRTFEQSTPRTLAVPGFTPVFATEFDAYLVGAADPAFPRLVYRDDLCAHVTLVSGRCLMGVGELLVGAATAERLHVAVGDVVTARWAEYSQSDGWRPAGIPATLSVVGIYAPRDEAEGYWGGRRYFDPRPNDRYTNEPVFTTRLTTEAMDHPAERQSVDSVAGPGALTPDRLDELHRQVPAAIEGGRKGGAIVSSGLPGLLDRIDANVRVVARVVPVAAVPLVVLCWFVVFLAVAYATGERRGELGLLALRGVRGPPRWWLGLGECALPVVAAAPLGYLAARGPTSPTAALAAVAAAVGALVAALLGQRRAIAAPAVELLRRVPSRLRRWPAMTAEAIVVALAVVAALQARGSGFTGVGLFAPALAILAVGLLAGRAVGPVAATLGRRALGRGRLTNGFAALQLARRPGGQRLLAVLVVAVGLLGFAATAVDVARQARRDRAEVGLGADRVLSISPVSRQALLAGVRAADPEGRFAMAVSTVDGTPDVLAVDSPRLAAVALWTGAPDVAARLHPPAPEPTWATGRPVVVDVTVAGATGLVAQFAPTDGSGLSEVDFGALAAGRHTYRGVPTGCEAGCRLAGLVVRGPGTLTVHGLRQDAAVLAPAEWRGVPAAGELRITGGTRVAPADSPDPLPSVTGGVLPRLGVAGRFVDLEYAERQADKQAEAVDPEVWLSAAAPPDVVERLRAHGLVAIGDRRLDDVRRALDRQGPATALRFHLVAAAFAVALATGALGVVGVVDRRGRVADVRVLRRQGVDVSGAARRTYLGVVGAALAVGPLAAAVAWALAGDLIPLYTDGTSPVPRPEVPGATGVVPALAGAAVVLLTAAALAACDTSNGAELS